MSIPADKAQLTFYEAQEEEEEGEKRRGKRRRREEKRESKERKGRRWACNGQTSINQALSMGYGIYREQPNAMAINQGVECQLYQYPLYMVTVALVHTEIKKHTHTHLGRDQHFSLFSWQEHNVVRLQP